MRDPDGDIRTIDEYIAACPAEARARLEAIRRLVRRLAPDAQEKISYRMPAFSLNGNLVYFAAFRSHIGFFPTASGVREIERELAPFKHAKGSIQLPLDEPLPLALIEKIVQFRIAENRAKCGARTRRRASK